MKKILLLLWCWLAIGGILWIIQAVIESATVIGTAPVFFAISAILATLAAWLISRRNLQAWSRNLGILYITLISALATGVLAFCLIISIHGFPLGSRSNWFAIAFALVGLTGGFLISRKGLWRGGTAAVAA